MHWTRNTCGTQRSTKRSSTELRKYGTVRTTQVIRNDKLEIEFGQREQSGTQSSGIESELWVVLHEGRTQ